MSLFRMLLSQQTDDGNTYSATHSVTVGGQRVPGPNPGQGPIYYRYLVGFYSGSYGSINPTSIFVKGVEGSIYSLYQNAVLQTSDGSYLSNTFSVTVNLAESVNASISYKITRLDTGVTVSGTSSISGESFDLSLVDTPFFTSADVNKTISVKIEITAT